MLDDQLPGDFSHLPRKVMKTVHTKPGEESRLWFISSNEPFAPHEDPQNGFLVQPFISLKRAVA